MPAELLVMCGSCGRPQRHPGAQEIACPSCGAALPAPVAVAPPTPRDHLINAYQPHLEADLGGGKGILLSERRLELHGDGPKPTVVELSKLASARLGSRPVWETWIFVVPLAFGAAFAPWLWLQIPLGAAAALFLAACFVQRRFAMTMRSKEGKDAVFVFGYASPWSPQAKRFRSVWQSVGAELERLGKNP